MKIRHLSLCILLACPALAEEDIEVISVTETRPARDLAPDSSDLLEKAPGAALPENGRLTKLAGYRGLFGNRIGVNLSGLELLTAGPNAMDSRLSQVPSSEIAELRLHDGPAPLSAGIQTLGGAIALERLMADTGAGLIGNLALGLNGGDRHRQGSAALNLGNGSQGLRLSGQWQKGGDRDSAFGALPQQYERSHGRLNLRHQGEQELWLDYQYQDTQDATTPALPMDINYIHAHLWQAGWQAGPWSLVASHQQTDHLMDNFSQRPAAMMSRQTLARGRANAARLAWQQQHWLLALDWQQSRHDATVTDPNNPMFLVDTFNDVSQDFLSALAEYDNGDWLLGLRASHHQGDAERPRHAMAAMMPAIATLLDRFDKANQDDSFWEAYARKAWQLGDDWEGQLTLARKVKVPDYQARYLWLPMQASGGLADGRTYVGNPELAPETALQLDAGLSWLGADSTVELGVFANQVDDYIQGLPCTDMAIKMAAAMMNDDEPLCFANTDALLWGLELTAETALADNLMLSGHYSLVRARDRDNDAWLYRVAPDQARLALTGQQHGWQWQLQGWLVASQDRVNRLNGETRSPGFGVWSLSLDWPSAWGQWHLALDNLLDKGYRPHLNGVSRIDSKAAAKGQRLPEPGRSLGLSWRYAF
ncbi:TonB-dependent receptor [Gallaecimonas sp. GXIMD4217]|uniref:TonB-dependent receptor n=1 Tax=Gallaecimonas sp. GXIMD4217 TaxID=3131927 RepID=UPI00311B1CB7